MTTTTGPTAFPSSTTPDRSGGSLVEDVLAGFGPDLDRPRIAFLPGHDGVVEAVVRWPCQAPLLADTARDFEYFGLMLATHAPLSIAAPAEMHRFELRTDCTWSPRTAALVVEAIEATATDGFEIDRFAVLVTAAHLDWRSVQLIRHICRYLRQGELTYSEDYVVHTLTANPTFTAAVVEFFAARFDPAITDDARAGAVTASEQRLDELLQDVTTLDADTILRGLRGFVRATLRTNWFRRDSTGAFRRYGAFQLDPSRLEHPGAVVPYREIFVSSPIVEGVHVRAGAVARGGLRLSDRPESYRTEVLGLMSTQTVKNSPIVPTGAKGAFVCRRPGTDAAEVYSTFIRGLLDVTDNLAGDDVLHPADTVVAEGVDAYLVVAADKGTARYSDLANSIAAEYGFWLVDAFASGGSNGYDHKAMGITARGAWVSVQRLFAELGIDVQTEPVTVVGIGDMSGDVFGNAMLQSSSIELVAAFDHRHIFIDPDPDPAVSYAARRALFDRPGSSWADYPTDAISAGGAVFDRDAKSVALSEQARRVLGIDSAETTPAELIRAVLRAPVDLLFNGGIGTYVKASTETHREAADAAGDAVRVDADELRCKVVGEGGNLGFTQRARIEYALRGGRINADFIDNAAGVATSDREVNLKIALDGAVTRGVLGKSERNDLLAACTEEVAAAVLNDCAGQVLAISLAESRDVELASRHERLIGNLEELGGLNRTRAVLPTLRELSARADAGRGLVRPEIAMLLAHSKNLVREELLDSDVPDEPMLGSILTAYFPPTIVRRCGAAVAGHRLRREIVATQLADELVNRVGPGLIYRLEERLGARTPQIALAYLVVRELFDIESLWSQAQSEVDVADPTSWRALHAIPLLIERVCAWLLREGTIDPQTLVGRLRGPVRSLIGERPRFTDPAAFELLAQAPALAQIALTLGRSTQQVARTYRALARELGMFTVAEQVRAGVARGYWESLAAAVVHDQIGDRLRELTAAVLATAVWDPDGVDPETLVACWCAERSDAIRRLRQMVVQAGGDGGIDVVRGCVVVAELSRLRPAA